MHAAPKSRRGDARQRPVHRAHRRADAVDDPGARLHLRAPLRRRRRDARDRRSPGRRRSLDRFCGRPSPGGFGRLPAFVVGGVRFRSFVRRTPVTHGRRADRACRRNNSGGTPRRDRTPSSAGAGSRSAPGKTRAAVSSRYDLRAAFRCSGVVVEDHRAVLRAEVRALAVPLRRVVAVPEDLEQLLVGDDRRVVLDLDDLGVARIPLVHHLVGRVGHWPPAYPETADFTPGSHSNSASTCQKQPAPNVAFSSLAGAFFSESPPDAPFPSMRTPSAFPPPNRTGRDFRTCLGRRYRSQPPTTLLPAKPRSNCPSVAYGWTRCSAAPASPSPLRT